LKELHVEISDFTDFETEDFFSNNFWGFFKTAQLSICKRAQFWGAHRLTCDVPIFLCLSWRVLGAFLRPHSALMLLRGRWDSRPRRLPAIIF
jgi:hypothetical protein